VRGAQPRKLAPQLDDAALNLVMLGGEGAQLPAALG
jgi:hypothetical protein